MRKIFNRKLLFILSVTIAVVLLLAASATIFAQKGIGAKYNSRDPQACGKTASSGKAPTLTEAAQSVKCSGEHEVGNESLFLYEDVNVSQIGKGSPYKPGVDMNVDDLDVDFLIYPIRGSFKKYQCGIPSLAREPGKSCRLYDEQNAQGRCYKDTFSQWQCSMSDDSLSFSDWTEAAPPGGANVAAKNKTAALRDEPPTTGTKGAVKADEAKADRDDSGFPKPDFSALEKWYEIVKYEYTDPAGTDRLLYIYLKPKVDINNRPLQFSVQYKDKDGVLSPLTGHPPIFGLIDAGVGEVTKAYAAYPPESEMGKITTVTVVRKKD